MIVYKDKLIADPGKCLSYMDRYMLVSNVSLMNKVKEVDIDYTNITHPASDSYVIDGKVTILNESDAEFNFMSRIYSPNEQLSVLFDYQLSKNNNNRDAYINMQGWRAWIARIVDDLTALN